MSKRYTEEKLRRGVVYVLSGRAVQAVSRAVLVLLVVRLLPAADYGAYMLLVGLSEMMLKLSSFGVQRVAQRFLPQVAESATTRDTSRFVASVSGLQFGLIGVFVALLWVFWDALMSFSGFSEQQVAASRVGILLFALVPAFKYLADLLETLLEQGPAQLTRAMMTIGRLLAIGGLLMVGIAVDLERLLLLDAVVTLGCFLAAGTFMVRALRRLDEPDDPQGIPLQDMVRHGWHMSVVDLLGTTHAPGAMRLVLANSLGTVESGLFAFLQSLQKVIGRYLPGLLLLGLVRPVLISRARTDRGVGLIEHATALMTKVNWVIVAGASMVALFAGDYIVDLASGGKFPDAGMTLLLMILILSITSQRRVLEMLLQIVDQTRILRIIALISPVTLVAAWVMARYGLNAAVFTMACGLAAGNILSLALLRARTSRFPPDWRGAIGIGLPAAGGAMVGILVGGWYGKWLAIPVACLLLLVLLVVFKPFCAEELRIIDRGMGRHAGRVLQVFSRSGG